MKAIRQYHVSPNIPSQLKALQHLACNVCFSWKSEIRDIFKRIDPQIWVECKHNPVLMLGLVSQERLEELAQDFGFIAQLERVNQDFDRYLSQPRIRTSEYCEGMPFTIAYFSAEFGLTECIPIYSGGLGILAGDHLKSSSDLNVPLVGIGLLYQEGYFSQYLTSDGWQMETYPANDFATMPIQLERDIHGEPLTVSVEFKGLQVAIYIWRIDVGRVPLYLLDTNVVSNPPEVRRVTAQLYGGDHEMRLQQEIVLGIGGIRALRALGIEPTVIHMNEGHSAFSAIERINNLRKKHNVSFDEAREIVIASTVFTTHTPVPAGNDVFNPGLVRDYFEAYAKELGINFKVLLGYGKLNPRDDAEPFGMSTLALRLSSHANGVSRLHGHVSRSIWHPIWQKHPVEDVPIEYVTNGIHVPTWISRDMAELFNRYLGPNWSEDPDNERVWDSIVRIPSTELWRSHERRKEQLVGFVRQHLIQEVKDKGGSTSEMQYASEALTPDAMTIGFARRFATYKRATLLFSDPDRLDRIVNNPKHPVQIIIAGKAHPQDTEGKEFIKAIIHLARQERFRRRIVFLSNYNIHIAHRFVSGSDVWLNTPRRPLEACGTSGMKALANGSLNVSVLDGWWDEGYNRTFGWAIGRGEVYQNYDAQDEIESKELYTLLEDDVIPLFYQRGHDGIPRGWVEKIRAGLRHLTPIFNSHRMVQEYVNRFYLPCSRRFYSLCSHDFSPVKELSAWIQKLMIGWSEISVLEVTSEDSPDKCTGDELTIYAHVRLGTLEPDDVSIEAYYGRLDIKGNFMERKTSLMTVKDFRDGFHVYQGRIPCQESGRFGYTVRVLPCLEKLEKRFVMGLIAWA